MTSIVPQAVQWRRELNGTLMNGGVFCTDILAFEMQDRQRVILENQSFVAFAAEVPFEVWIAQEAPGGLRSDLEREIRFGPSPS